MEPRQRDPEVAKKPAYISYCRHCGGITGCCADSPERAKDAAQFVSECIGAGQIVERKTAANVWGATWCGCPELMRGEPQEVQAGLFETQNNAAAASVRLGSTTAAWDQLRYMSDKKDAQP